MKIFSPSPLCIPPFPCDSLNTTIHFLTPRWLSTAERETTSTQGMVGGLSAGCQKMTHGNHTPPPPSQTRSNELSGWQESFLSQTFQNKWFYTLFSRKVQVSKLKVPIFFCGPFCRFYKRSTSKIKWPDHQMLAVLEVADFDFWVAGSNSLSVHCHFPLPSLRVSYLLKMKGFEQERRSSLPVLLFHSQCCRTNTDEDHDDNEENNNEHWSRWRCSSVLPRPLRWDSGIPRHKGCVTLNFN